MNCRFEEGSFGWDSKGAPGKKEKKEATARFELAPYYSLQWCDWIPVKQIVE